MYKALKLQLDDRYHVFYSSPWLGTRPDGSEVDGEADFLVAHPSRGMLSIEVKGGRVSIDKDSRWTSKDRYGIVRKIKNPVEQARRSKYELLHKLKESNKWRSRFIHASHGVILPDVSRPDRAMRPDMPLNIFAFAEDMAFLDAWVSSRLDEEEDGVGTGRVKPLDDDGLAALDDLLARPIRLEVKLGANVREDLREIGLKTDEQIWVMRDLEVNKRMAISGAAGTGKTILAQEKALMLAEQDKKTLLLCYNKPLSLHLKKVVEKHPLITATHFDKLCRDVAEAAGALDEGSGHAKLAEELVDNFAASGFEEYDAVIIDEGQDFKDEWLESLEIVVKDTRNGVLYIFYDDNQNVTGSSVNYLNALPAAGYRLSRNFRNTKTIFKQASHYYEGGSVKSMGPEGTPILWHPFADGVNLRTTVSERVGALVSNEGLAVDDITVLFPTVDMIEELRHKGKICIGRYALSNAEEGRAGKITVDSVRRFKGLESPVILLVLSSKMARQDELLYTGITRAQSLLEVFGPPRLIQRLKELI